MSWLTPSKSVGSGLALRVAKPQLSAVIEKLHNLNKVVAYHRWDQGGPGDDVIIILNFSNRYWDSYRVGLPRLGTWWCRFSSDWSGYSSDFSNFGGHAVSAEYSPKDGMAYSAGFALAPYSAVIYSQ